MMLRCDGEPPTYCLENGNKRLQRRVPSGDSARYNDSRLMPAAAATAIGFCDGVQCNQSACALIGIVERFHGELEVADRKLPVGAQFFDLAVVMRNGPCRQSQALSSFRRLSG